MNVRFVSDVEREQWQGLFEQYAEFYEVEMNDSIISTVWQWINDPEKDFDCLVAVDQGELVGFMHFYSVPSPVRGKSIGFLNDLFVAKSYRGSGAFEQLFQKLNAIAASRSWDIVRWNTAESNERARAAYAKVATLTHWKVYQLDTAK